MPPMNYLDRKLTSWMVEDFQRDPILAGRVILGLEFPPHQEVRIMGMWSSAFMVDSSGYSTGKTFCMAVCAALRGAIFEDRTAGMLSKTYEQGKLIFDYFDRWVVTCPLFKAQLGLNKQNKPDLVHGTGVHVATFRNGNTIRVLPPDLMKDAERIKSERWNDAYFDEWASWGNFQAMMKTCLGRATRPVCENYDADDPMFLNHVFWGSTAGYKWDPAYNLVQDFVEQVDKGRRDYAVQSWNFEDIPERFARFVDSRNIEVMLRHLPRDVALMEIYGKWVEDSLGWYSAKALHDARDARCSVLLSRKKVAA